MTGTHLVTRGRLGKGTLQATLGRIGRLREVITRHYFTSAPFGTFDMTGLIRRLQGRWQAGTFSVIGLEGSHSMASSGGTHSTVSLGSGYATRVDHGD